MSKEVLEKKIAELLNVPENEASIAFTQFKEKLAEQLQIGEAVKIQELGVFQLKEQLSHDETSLNGSTNKDLTLVFSSDSDQHSEDSLFLNLEIKQDNKDENEFDESIFQLGVGKPLATIENIQESEGSASPQNLLTQKIDELLEKSEKLENFDLWEDYLKNKESKDVLEDLSEQTNDELDDLLVEDKPSVESDDLLSDDSSKNDQDNLIEDYLEESDFVEEGKTDNLTEDIFEEDIKEISLEESLDISIDEITSEINESDELNDINIDEKINFVNDTVEEESEELSELDLESKLEEVSEDLNLAQQVEQETIQEEEEQEKNSEINSEEEKLEGEKKGAITEFKDDVEVKYRHGKKRRSPIIYALWMAFLVVCAIGIYYLFINDLTWLYDEHELKVAESQKQNTELVESTNITDEGNIDNQTELNDELGEESGTVENQTNDVAENPKVIEEQTEIEPNKESIEKSTKETDEPVVENDSNNSAENVEREVGKNIYFDDFTYNVQVSSWKKEDIARKEVNRLMKKGFPAFLVKVYIAKFDGTWHRVRIGPFVSLEEAKAAQEKL